MRYVFWLLSLHAASAAPRGPISPLKLTPAPSAVGLTSIPTEVFFGRPRPQAKRQNIHFVKISWVMPSEVSTQGYYVERSLDGLSWQRLSYLPCSPGHRYKYQDSCLAAAYYRVTRLDFSRRREASTPLLVPSLHIDPPLLVQPYPARGLARLRNYKPDEPAELFNSGGRLVYQIGDSVFSTEGLLPGIYAIRQGQQIARLIVR